MSDFRPCRECKDWKGCLLTLSEREWFGYHHLRFCPIQVFWLLRYEEILRGFGWPVAEDALGGMSGVTIKQGNFVQVAEAFAELDPRIERTRLKGKLLRAECKMPSTNKVEYRFEFLSEDAKDALYYVSGDKRKKSPFTTWLAKKRKREGR